MILRRLGVSTLFFELMALVLLARGLGFEFDAFFTAAVVGCERRYCSMLIHSSGLATREDLRVAEFATSWSSLY
jgi:hypothetical protein